jgi:hypothetical protein
VLSSSLDGMSIVSPDVLVNRDTAAAPQNETAIAVDPNNASRVVAAANDYVTERRPDRGVVLRLPVRADADPPAGRGDASGAVDLRRHARDRFGARLPAWSGAGPEVGAPHPQCGGPSCADL